MRRRLELFATAVRERREPVLFGLLLLFVVGYYWLPARREHGSDAHDVLFLATVLPVFLLAWPGGLARAVRSSRLTALALLVVAYFGASSLWTVGRAELSAADIALATLGTAVLIAASSLLLDRRRFALFSTTVAAAATSIAVISAIRFILEPERRNGRLASAIHYEHPNLFAHYLGFAAVLCLLRWVDLRRHGRGRPALWAAAATLLWLAVVQTHGRAATFGLAVAALVVAAATRDRRALALIAAVVTTTVAISTFGRIDLATEFAARRSAGRTIIYETLLERTLQHPWIGHGLAAHDSVAIPPGSTDFPSGILIPHAHSVLVAAIYFGGAVGAALFLLLVIAGLRSAVHQSRAGDPTGLSLLAFALITLAVDGHRLVSNPHLSSWLLLWIPIATIANRERGTPVPSAAGAAVHPAPATGSILPRWLFWGLVLFLCGQRLAHFGPDLDQPHMWRQSDTAQYIWAFYEDGIDLLHPSVCWLGDHRTTILEMPLPEAVAAVAYHLFGPHHTVARAVFFAAFLASALLLYHLVRNLADDDENAVDAARASVVLYLAMPLSLFYSRAVHIDFSAILLAHAMALCYLRGLRRESVLWMGCGSAFAALALMVKAPYVLPFAPPLILLVTRERRWRQVARALPSMALALTTFALWQGHVLRVNGQAPDWDFIPGYRKMVNSWTWYFGTLEQRLQINNWRILGGRLWREVLGAVALVPFAAGAILAVLRGRLLILAWLVGAGLTTVIFFNLNVMHNYYQIPFLAPVAALVAMGLLWIARHLDSRRVVAVAFTGLILAAAAGEHVRWAETNYYGVLHGLLEAGEILRRETPVDALPVVAAGSLDCRSPHLLYQARRYGWTVPMRVLRPELVARLQAIGATHLAVVTVGALPLDLVDWLGDRPARVVPLSNGRASVHLYDLGDPGSPAS